MHMKRSKDYIIFPLDVPSFEEAHRLTGLLAGEVGMFKVGLELFIREGADVIKMIHDYGDAGIFLDLKLHDIPVTVERAVEQIADFDVDLATVHCGESRKMLEHAVKGSGGRVNILGVTVLTSVSGEDILTAGFVTDYAEDMERLVMKRAEMAKAAGCAGVVCSGHEAGLIKSRLGDGFLAVTPGIRPSWQGISADDQKRVMTPAQAVKNGSDYIVIGRPLRNASDPREAARRVADEIEAVL